VVSTVVLYDNTSPVGIKITRNFSADVLAWSASDGSIGFNVVDSYTYTFPDATTPTGDITLTGTLSLGDAPEVNFPSAAAITYGETLSESTLTGGTTGRGNFAWEEGSTVPTVEDTEYTVVFTPTDKDDYDYSGIGWDGNSETVRQSVNITVKPKAITATDITATKVYDGNANFAAADIDATAATLKGIVVGDNVSLDATAASGSLNSADVVTGDDSGTFGGFTLSGTDAGNYTLTQPVDVTAGITKATPTAGHLQYTLPASVYYTGASQGIGVTWKDAGGDGAITVMYNGSTATPTAVGTYNITADIAEGTNFTATATPLALGTFTILAVDDPSDNPPNYYPLPAVCTVTLPEIEGATTIPSAGRYNVPSGEDFEFVLRPTVEEDGRQLLVATGRLSDAEDGVVITPQADGSYHVRIVNVRLNLTLSAEFVTATGLGAAQGLRVWASASRLYLAAGSRPVNAKVFTLTGALTATLRAAAGETTTIALPSGVYFIATDDGSRWKVFVERD
jgi:hypothetical protein